LYVQQSIIQNDIQKVLRETYENETTKISKLNAQTKYDVTNFNFDINILVNDTDADIKRIIAGYLVYSKGNTILQKMSAFLSSQSNVFLADPYSKFFLSSEQIALSFQEFLSLLLLNIKEYFSLTLERLNIHPVSFIANGTLNTPSYLNAFGLVPQVPNSAPTNSNNWEYNLRDGLSKWHLPPSPNCEKTTRYNGPGNRYEVTNEGCYPVLYDQTAADALTITTMYNHNPGGVWWRDSRPLPNSNDEIKSKIGDFFTTGNVSPRCDTKYGAQYGVQAWAAFNCVAEWPQELQKISLRDFYMNQQPNLLNIQPYNRMFMATNDGWEPNAYSPDGISILTQFISDKNNIAAKNNITSDIKNTYRWKPISYLGTLTNDNLREIKNSAIYSAYFNFTDQSTIENQIRVSSENYCLYYSPL
jgi:hypothetical protein